MGDKIGLLIAPVALAPGAALAGAWPQAPGETQVIASYEPGTATRAFDSSGDRTLALSTWQQTDATLFIDHGVSQHFTFTAKVDLQSYKTATARFSGLGSLELGGRWTVHQGKTFVLALGASAIGGQGRRETFDMAGKHGTDYDLRAYAGHAFKIRGIDAFVDLQAARYLRQKETNQWRLDATLGVKPSPRWMVMAQVFAGQTDKQAWGQSKWANTQLSVVRNFGPQQNLSLQLAVRQTVAGRSVPAVNAVVISLWKRF
ncbi:MAG: hypothetical protein WDN06_22925 [Asticcacaulis sp.]